MKRLPQIWAALLALVLLAGAHSTADAQIPLPPRVILVPGPTWGGWENLGGAIVSAPTCFAPAENRLECYARGGDGSLQRKWWDGSAWNGWQPLPGVLLQSYDDGAGAGPSCFRDNSGTTHCFVWGADNALWHRWLPQSGNGWWEHLGGVLTAAPSCAAAPDAPTISCFGRGQNGALWQRVFDGNVWGGWTDRGGSVAPGTNPSCVARSGGRVDCVIVGAGNTLYHGVMSGGAGGWRQISGNQVMAYGGLGVSPRCHAHSAGIACYAPRGPTPRTDTFSVLRATLEGAAWGVSDLGADLGYAQTELSCLDDAADRLAYECFAINPGSQGAFGAQPRPPVLRTFATSPAAPSAGWGTALIPTPPTANPTIHRLSCVSWAPGRIDCFSSSSAGGPMMHVWRTPSEPPLTRFPRRP